MAPNSFATSNLRTDAVFAAFCGAGRTDMDGQSFAKLCKDARLIDRQFTSMHVDCAFARVVPKGGRLDRKHFEAALRVIAEKKDMNLEVVLEMVEQLYKTVMLWAKVEASRNGDDAGCKSSSLRSSRRSSLAKSGLQVSKGDAATPRQEPGSAPRFAASDTIAALARKEAQVEGMSDSLSGALAKPEKTEKAEKSREGKAKADVIEGALRDVDQSDLPALGSKEAVFKAFCRVGRAEMDGKSFAKLCDNCHLICDKLSTSDVDLIFTKVASKGHRRNLDFEQFDIALRMTAEKLGWEEEKVFAAVERSSGPKLRSTKADAVRLHMDKKTNLGSRIAGHTDPYCGEVYPWCDSSKLIAEPSMTKAPRAHPGVERLLVATRFALSGSLLMQGSDPYNHSGTGAAIPCAPRSRG
eukprot:gnl/TRDRNA2_/TRDRNA2_166788_c0_seq2.p1 gnl/TRDRNA2_/TRDRNA2_166788_c0~~gnl/TRDRNA2_/TRDRNA2_166788_c0_seq2.p1  ORF type:complete len:411 (+),score=86.07 gnl/TRDRNA2_/TRDRNA2_166788_c0_seq2:164-1396(+)